MFSNYLKTASRSLWRNKRYSIINITGLTLGIAVCLVIFVIIRYEKSFDGFHAKKDRIFRVLTVSNKPGGDYSYTEAVPFPLPTALHNDFPDMEEISGVASFGERLVSVADSKGNTYKKFKPRIFFLEPSFFRIFDFTWLAGDKSTALNDPNSIVLSRSVAEKYFGDWRKAMGKTLRLDQLFSLTVTGVLDDPPSNSEFQLQVVVPYSHPKFGQSKDWVSLDDIHHCYVLLRPGQTAAQIDRRLVSFSKKYKAADNESTHKLQPLARVHTDTATSNFMGRVVSVERIRALWLIAVFILLIACMNFINLSTAQAVNRAREIGVRKVLGSRRWQLQLQFLTETCILVFTSLLLAVTIASFILRFIGLVMELPLHPQMLLNIPVFLLLAAILVMVTFLAGGYPSMVLAGFNPVNALKSKVAASRSKAGISLRRGLVVFQFIIAQALIIGTLIILQQLNYFRNQPLGFSPNAMVNVPFRNDSAGNSKIGYLRDQLKMIKGVEQVSFSNSTPSEAGSWWTPFNFDHAEKHTDFAAISKWVDADFVDTYGLQLLAGRSLTRTDSVREFIVNETLVKKLGLARPEDILYKEIDVWNGFAKGPVVGVVRDFHTGPLKDAIGPVFMCNVRQRLNSAGVRLSGSDLQASIKAIEKLWTENFPEQIFEYQFLDDKISSFYKEEQQLAQLYKIFAGIAIFLSCLGLYGLASFMAVQRLREVGVRKVLGATASNIVLLFSKEFMVLIGIAFVLATPLVWYFMRQWLQHYVYRIDIGWGVFLAGGIASMAVALVTVSFQAVKAAMTNPVKSLKAD
ncbi:ABC transporter permease [Chitinophaga sp. XS-30]|uniref:ABC transporter permease n=1 Tax=Chitinophaga sp. XS-30 TaxID=2604421 RepID=UPI0011DDBC22|nr:ABC transporter permease [Chitinophaga sp. XS-30]QEH42257.1 FtsX-like permease family protein [Chitinophaga sp. XS-30]